MPTFDYGWSDEENKAFFDVLLRQRNEEPGSSARFGKSVWEELVSSLPRRPGIRRTADACKRRWQMMRDNYFAISDITRRFGWDDKRGASIGDDNNEEWKAFLAEQRLISGQRRRAASQYRNRAWNLSKLKEVSRVIERPLTEPEEDIVQQPSRKLIPEVVIVRRHEHEIFLRHLASRKPSPPCEPKVPKFKFKEERDVDISLFTSPLPDILPDEIPVYDSQDLHRRLTKRASPNFELESPIPMAKRRRHSPPAPDGRPDETIGNSVLLSNSFLPDTELSVRESRMEAIKRVQALEMDLSDQCIVALIDLFETKAEAADVYLSLTRESVRKQWVANRVRHIREQEEQEGIIS